MIKETATVIKCEGEFAWVEAQRQSTCGGCAARKGCGTAVLSKIVGKKMSRVKVLNTIHAKVGETVTIGLQEGSLLSSSFVIYFIPLMMMILFAMLGDLVARQMLMPVEATTIVFAVAGFLLSGVLIKIFSRAVQSNEKYQPVILQQTSHAQKITLS